ncbi:Uncharacterised protein [uncultured archaeon]|nr:Uncharacterised protein [uncultured archaeon]
MVGEQNLWIAAAPVQSTYEHCTEGDILSSYQQMMREYDALFSIGVQKTGECRVERNHRDTTLITKNTLLQILQPNGNANGNANSGLALHHYVYTSSKGLPRGEANHLSSVDIGAWIIFALKNFYQEHKWHVRTDVLKKVDPENPKKPIDELIIPTLLDILTYQK